MDGLRDELACGSIQLSSVSRDSAANSASMTCRFLEELCAGSLSCFLVLFLVQMQLLFLGLGGRRNGLLHHFVQGTRT